MLTIKASQLRALITPIIPCVDRESARPWMECALWNCHEHGLTLTGTDGVVMGEASAFLDNTDCDAWTCLVHGRGLRAILEWIKGLESVEITCDGDLCLRSAYGSLRLGIPHGQKMPSVARVWDRAPSAEVWRGAPAGLDALPTKMLSDTIAAIQVGQGWYDLAMLDRVMKHHPAYVISGAGENDPIKLTAPNWRAMVMPLTLPKEARRD